MSLRRLGFDRLASGIFLHLDRVWLEGPGGERHARDVIQHPGGVAVLPVDGDDVLLVRQYRVAVDRWVLEIPAGKLDQPGEPPDEAARRELTEELGVHAKRLVALGSTLPSPGYTSEEIHLFAAEGILDGERAPHGLEEESAELIRMPLREALQLVDEGQIIDAKTQIALSLWARRSMP